MTDSIYSCTIGFVTLYMVTQMSANLDGYNTPKDGIHKTEMLKRIDKLEESVLKLATVLEMMSKTIYEGEENADKREL